MENFNYYEALDGCDVDFQKKKRRIAEVEDAIENLKMSADEDDKENLRQKEMLKCQELEGKIRQSDLNAATAQKKKICDEIDQCEHEIAELNKKILRTRTEMDESEAFIQTQLNETIKCKEEYYKKFLKYPWVSKYDDIKKQQEIGIKTVKEKEARIISLEMELTDLCSQERQKWKKFVGVCVEISQDKSKLQGILKTTMNNTADNCSIVNNNLMQIPSSIFNVGDSLFNGGTKHGINGVNQSLSRSIISQRTSPSYSYKIRPFRERQMSSFSTFQTSHFKQ